MVSEILQFLGVLSACPVCDVRVLWPNGCMDQDETWRASRPRPWSHCVRWGPSSLPERGTAASSFWPMSIVAKRLDGWKRHLVRWPRPRPHCVRWGPAPFPPKGHSPPIFGPYLLRPNGCMDQDATRRGARPRPRRLLWPNGWMDQDGTWHGGRPQPRPLCVRWGPSPPPKFSAHIYYNDCDFVITLHTRYCSSSSSSSSILCILFL